PKEQKYQGKSDILDALTAIDPDDPELIPFLIRAMDDRDASARLHAVRNLGVLGRKAKHAVPELQARLFNPKDIDKGDILDDLFVKDLITAIVRIAPGSAKTAATLLKALRDQDIRSVHCPKNTWYMRDVLEDQLQANLPAAAPVLREALKDADVEVRQSA